MKLAKLAFAIALPLPMFAAEGALSVFNEAWPGLYMNWLMKVEPSGAAARQISEWVLRAPDGAHRVILDMAEKRYFGYDLHAKPLDGGATLQVSLTALTLPETSLQTVGVGTGWTMLPPPKFPLISVMHAGDTVSVDLLVNPATGQKMVDYISLRRIRPDSPRGRSIPRDFSVAEAQLNLDHPHILLDGKPVPGPGQDDAGIIAHVLWLWLPGPGSFVLSLAPEARLGFHKAGTVSGKTITFHEGSAEYRIECQTQIAPGSGVYNLYVFHDAVWRQPGGVPDSPIVGGADKAEYLGATVRYAKP